MSKRVIFIITSEFHLRSFVTSRVTQYLGSAQILLVVDHSLLDSAKSIGLPVVSSDFSNPLGQAYAESLEVHALHDLFKSSSLRFRLRRMLLGDYLLPTFSRASFSRFIKVATGVNAKSRSKVLARYETLCHELAVSISGSMAAESDLVVAWATNYDPGYVVGFELATLHTSPFVAVFDNWDNLSSKGILRRLPDWLVCFGAQSGEFSETIHGASPAKTLPLGSGRFDVYQDYIPQGRSTGGDVLFAGTSIPHEDLRVIRLLKATLNSKNGSAYGDRIFYKPHPNPQAKVDLGIEGVHYLHSGASDRVGKWETQEELAKRLIQFKLIVCGPTSLLLEASTLGIEVIIPSFVSCRVWASNRRMLRMLKHLQGVESLPNVTVCQNPTEFAREIRTKLFASDRGPGVDHQDLNKFLTFDANETFGQRLGKSLSAVLSGTNPH